MKLVLNVQHDCERADCPIQSVTYQTQERQETTRRIDTVKHTGDAHFIINMHTLHNPHIIHTLFNQKSYSIPATDSEDRISFHKRLASELRERQTKTKPSGKGKGREISTINEDNGVQPETSEWHVFSIEIRWSKYYYDRSTATDIFG